MADEFIAAAFGPVALVVSSKDADTICARNHLSFTEMLQPFCQFTVKPNYAEPFALRLVTLKDLVRSTVKEAQEATYGAVASHAIKLPTADDKLSETLGPQSTPWFNAYCREFLGLVRASEHEYFNQPVACISVVSTAHANPVAFLEQSFSSENPPRPFTANSVLDPNLVRYYVILHDGSKGDEAAADDIFEKAGSKFGAKNCFKLVINTMEGNKEPDDGMKDIWKDCVRRPSRPSSRRGSQTVVSSTPEHFYAQKAAPSPADAAAAAAPAAVAPSTAAPAVDGTNEAVEDVSEQKTDPLQRRSSTSSTTDDPLRPSALMDVPGAKPGILGERLSMADIKQMRGCITAFGTDCLIPHLESLAAKLGSHIAHTKKSALSSARKWLGFGASEKKHAAEYKDDPLLAGMSVKAAMRRLADVAFTLQDYETAINTYHSVKKEYNHEKAWKDSAGASEMEGLAMYLQSPRRQDPVLRYFEVAFQYYERAQAQIYLCRATLLAAQIAMARGQLMEASMAFMKSANEESDLRSALLLEQVAVCFTQVRPPREKRAAFHLVLAGHRFVKAGLRQHALRCYMQARSVYSGNEWSFAEDHVNYTVGKQALMTARREDAMKAFTTLLCEHNQQISSQKQYVKDFVQSWKAVNNGVGDGTAELPLPFIVDNKMELQLGGTTGRVTNAAWRAMEGPLLIAARPKRQRVSSMSTFSKNTKVDTNPIAVASETFVLSVTLYNPLRVTIDLRDVQLIGTIKGGGEDDATPLAAKSEPSVKIGAKTSKVVHLSATPSIQGQVELSGIQFSLSGTVFGCRKFEGKGPRLNRTKEHRLEVMYGPDYRLLPLVIPPMPRIEGSIIGIGESLLVGEVITASLNLVNTSEATLFRLFVGSSCKGGMLTFGKVATTDCEGAAEVHVKETVAKTDESEVRMVELELPAGLPAGSTISVPLFYTATPSDAGKQDLMFMAYYEAQTPHSRLPYRILKLSHTVNVLSSMILANYVYAIPGCLSQRILRVNATNAQGQGFDAKLLSIVYDASHWEAEAVQSYSAEGCAALTTVSAGETSSLVYRLTRRLESAANERKVLGLAADLPLSDCHSAELDRTVSMDAADDSMLTFQLIWETSTRGGDGDEATPTRGYNTSVAALSLAPTVAVSGHIDVTLRCPGEVTHDFAANNSVRIEATLILKNNCDTTASGAISLDDPQEDGGQNGFIWVGRTKVTVADMPPGGVVEVPVTALAVRPGVYNLAKFSLDFEANAKKLPAIAVPPALVALRDT
mmetsp:Transcript_33114/g.100146  ORF Transcript_33114/g.100146 Transcript_33114/m.100146 type:complete len:1262 (+) Transcript_33114:123-3908(+)